MCTYKTDNPITYHNLSTPVFCICNVLWMLELYECLKTGMQIVWSNLHNCLGVRWFLRWVICRSTLFQYLIVSKIEIIKDWVSAYFSCGWKYSILHFSIPGGYALILPNLQAVLLFHDKLCPQLLILNTLFIFHLLNSTNCKLRGNLNWGPIVYPNQALQFGPIGLLEFPKSSPRALH
jgi:hypothetical protein